MGDRGQVFIKEEGVYLYTHWGARGLVLTVRKALSKNWRWDNQEYLARIIFDEMIGKDQGTETGYGIGTQEHGDIWRLITITKDKIKVEDHDHIVFEGIYDEFIKQTFK